MLATEDEDEYSEAWVRLSESGIPVFEPSKNSDMPGLRIGPSQRVICIWLDHQYEDAIRLLRDPSHVVRNPVSPEEFARAQEKIEATQGQTTSQRTENVLNWLVSFLALSLILVVAYVAIR